MLRGAFAYLVAAFKEALRLFPTAPTLMRRLEADVRLGRTTLRKGEVVAVAVYSMHRDPAYWQVSGLWHHLKPYVGFKRAGTLCYVPINLISSMTLHHISMHESSRISMIKPWWRETRENTAPHAMSTLPLLACYAASISAF